MLCYSCKHLRSIKEMHQEFLFRKKLGQGSFCDVFLAEKRSSGEMVAVKMIMVNPDKRFERHVISFRQEMMLYKQLNHPNIIKALDSGETDTGVLFIVFEYIKGKTIAEIMKKEGRLSVSRTINLMRQVLYGLSEAHSKGIIHRDLKPENIMVISCDNSETIRLLDFGMSKHSIVESPDEISFSRIKEFTGTPLYAAPEQLRGEQISAKADIYSWGLLFLECITGKSPFSGNTVAGIVQQQLADSPVPVPAEIKNHQLGTLLCWTLDKREQRRAGSAAVIATLLDEISTADIPQIRS